MPDSWESLHGLNPSLANGGVDPDGDGLSNLQEFLNATLPQSPDTDGDGLPDGWEITAGTSPYYDDAQTDSDLDGLAVIREYTAGTNPFLFDTDLDQMSDGWEWMSGISPTVANGELDPDGDGVSNLAEYVSGTDPDDSASNGLYIGISISAGLPIGLVQTREATPAQGYGLRRRYYTLEASDLPPPGDWAPVPGYTGVLGLGQPISMGQAVTNQYRFLRAQNWLQP
jgi:hypothetical protein